MRFIAQHIIPFLILFFAFSAESRAEGMSAHLNDSEYGCECCEMITTFQSEEEKNECSSCCCISQPEKDMHFSPVSSLVKAHFLVTTREGKDRESKDRNLTFLEFTGIPVQVTRTSIPFLQVILE